MKSDIQVKKEKHGKASKERTGVVNVRVTHAGSHLWTELTLNRDTIVLLQSLGAIVQGAGTLDLSISSVQGVMALVRENKLNIKNISYPITVEMWLPNMIEPSMLVKSLKSRTGKRS